tara:strand:- start:9847 stop:10296 length:450 start_codon:yes stop_codon:yes gene_type:complete
MSAIDSWGPALWRFLHASSFAFPEAPNPTRRTHMLDFLSVVGRVLPCATCRSHYEEYIRSNLDERAVQSRDTLVRWVLDLHNSVNRRRNVPEWTLTQLRRVYDPDLHSKELPNPKITLFGFFLASLIISIVFVLCLSQVRRLPNRKTRS